jgi:UDP-3-O-[3-hydroxymyristoyl] N-acetylglucosamine deacetylase
MISDYTQRRTLSQASSRQGIGLHSGVTTQVTLQPAPAGTGRVFMRTDLADRPTIPAAIDAVRETMLSTELVAGDASVRTVEHLLAALSGLGISDVWIEIDGPEVPLLDGSAKEWLVAIQEAEPVSLPETLPTRTLTEPLWLRDGDAFVAGLPAQECRFSYGIDFDLPAIGNQWFSLSLSPQTFAREIAPARTFGLAHQIEQLQTLGLIKGGSLDNALVCSESGWLNPPLRYENEPVRHKLLDLTGDLSLLGEFPLLHVIAYKASHRLHTDFARQVRERLVPVS